MSDRPRKALQRTTTSAAGDMTRDELIVALVDALRAEQSLHTRLKREEQDFAAHRQASAATVSEVTQNQLTSQLDSLRKEVATLSATVSSERQGFARWKALHAQGAKQEMDSLREQVASLAAALSSERQSNAQWQAQQTQNMATMQREMRSFWLMATPAQQVARQKHVLAQLEPSKLRAAAQEAGVEPTQLQQALSGDDPTAALIELLLARLASKGVAAAVLNGGSGGVHTSKQDLAELTALRSECAGFREREAHTRHATVTTARLLGEALSRITALEQQQPAAARLSAPPPVLQTSKAARHPPHSGSGVGRVEIKPGHDFTRPRRLLACAARPRR
eukprot:COSAG05_NODE_3561_length_1990_cov_1.299841_1_plen_336_part_00